MQAPQSAGLVATAQPDPIGSAAAKVVLSPVLPPSVAVQVPWSVRVLRGLATVLFAISIICLFAAGGIVVAGLFEGPVVVLALLAYATGFGWLCRKLRL